MKKVLETLVRNSFMTTIFTTSINTYLIVLKVRVYTDMVVTKVTATSTATSSRHGVIQRGMSRVATM